MNTLLEFPLQLLQTFVTFAESPNIVVAAKRLRISQPSVSVQLKRLEALMSQPLFTFQGKKKVLSPYGRAVFDAIHDKLSLIQRGLEQVNLQFEDPSHLQIRVGLRREVLLRISQSIQFPGIITFRELSNAQILEGLKKQEIDLGVTYERPNSPLILAKPLFSETTYLSVHQRWLQGKKLSLSLIETSEFLLGTPALAYKSEDPPFLKEWFGHHKIPLSKLKPRIICEDWSAISRMIENGMGYSILPGSSVPSLKEVQSLPIDEKIIPRRIFYLLYPKALRGMSELKDAFQKTSC